MKSLATFKRIARNLRKEIENAQSLICECEYKYDGNPCSLTRTALSNANYKLVELEAALENAEEMISHYDFYKSCYEQEQNEEMARNYYIGL